MELEDMYVGYMAVTRLLSFFALFMVVGVLTRSAIQSFALSEGALKHPMQDVVAAFEVYGCNMGHIYVFQIYGLGTHLVVLLTVGIFHAFFLKGCTANPITHILQYLMNCCPVNVTITKISALVLGGLVGHLTAIAVWPVLMTEFDRESMAEMHCVAASTLTPVIVCLCVEFLGMILICILVLNITSSSVDAFEPPMKFIITCVLSGTGLCASNIYLNPVVASSRLIGCHGNDFIHHLVIYWVAPIGGAAVAVLYTKFTSNCDLVCLPCCESQTSCLQISESCAELESDFNPDLPCSRNLFCQAPRSSMLVSKVQMPPTYVSRAEEDEEVEDENSDDDEVIYSCAKDPVGTVNALNYDKQADMSTCRRRCDEQPFDDTCCRGFPGPNTTWPLGTVTSSKPYGMHNCAPISSGGRIPDINQSLCGDLGTVSDCMTVTDSCCGYREAMSYSCHGATVPRPFCTSVYCDDSTCDKTNNMASAFCPSRNTPDAQLPPAPERCLKSSSSLVPAQSECNYSGDQSCTVCSVPSYVCSSPATVTQDTPKTCVPPTRQRSQHPTFKQPLRDNSQTQRTDSDELVAKPSIHKLQVISPPRESKPQLDEEPPQNECVPQPPQTPSPCVSKGHQPSKSPVFDECMPRPPTQPPQTPSPCVSKGYQPSQSPACDVPSSQLKPSQPCPTRTHSKPSHKHHHKSSCHRKRTSKHKKPSQKCPCGAQPTPSHNRPHTCTSGCGTHTTLHPGPTKPDPTPSHNRHKLSPSRTKHRTPSCHRSRDTSHRRASATPSKPHPTCPESCMF